MWVQDPPEVVESCPILRLYNDSVKTRSQRSRHLTLTPTEEGMECPVGLRSD